MKTFHVDEPREIGRKRERVSPKDMMMVKKDLKERIIIKIREKIKQRKKSGI